MVEQIDVRCHRCNESCYGEVINTYGTFYHQYCFSCIVAGCNHELTRVGYFLVDGELYCSNDYRKLNGIKCSGCSKYVEGEAISALNSRFHPTCFGCIMCGKVFPAGAEVCFDGEDFFCLKCNISPNAPFKVQSEPLPSKKEEVIPPKSVKEEVIPPKSVKEEVIPPKSVKEEVIPPKSVKEEVIPPKSVKEEVIPPKSLKEFVIPPKPLKEEVLSSKPLKDEEPHTPAPLTKEEISHSPSPKEELPLVNGNTTPIDEVDKTEKNTGTVIMDEIANITSGQCAGCENFIKNGQALLALDKQWHLWCFTCFKCGALLTGEYMGRDGIPYCEKDYQAEFGITCAGCGEYITGKVLQAGEKHYHPNCSRCAKCGEMFGEGQDMYLQGSEIWHPHCSEEDVQSDVEESDISKSEYESEGSSPKDTPRKEVEEDDVTASNKPVNETKPINETKPDENNSVLPVNLNPVPFGKPTGFRSVKPPGFRSVKPPQPFTPQPPLPTLTTPPTAHSSDDDKEEAPPPVPPPPARSTSNQWRQKYASRNMANTSTEKPRPKSYAETSSPEIFDKKDTKEYLQAAYSTTSLNSNCSGSNIRKGIGINKLQHRMNSQKDIRRIQLPTNIDPDRLREFLNDPDHNVYLEDHEFYDLFKMTREKFYSLPQAKKQELKSGILFS